MKVKLGNFPTHWSSYSVTSRFEENGWISEKVCDRIDNFFQPSLNFIWNDRYWNKRKEYVRIDKSDTWAVDHTLALIIHPVLVKFKQHNNGFPPIIDLDDLPENLKTIVDTDDVQAGEVQWDWILDEMIWAFEQSADDSWEEQFFTSRLIKFDKDNYKKHYQRIQNGQRLFGKYYNNLWW